MFRKEIVFCDRPAVLICDGQCSKAWGINSRPRVQLSDNPDDYEYLADEELGDAPVYPGTYECGHGKPAATNGQSMNKWCSRECERSEILQPGEPEVSPDLSARLKNLPITEKK